MDVRIDRDELDDAVAAFLARGGEIEALPEAEQEKRQAVPKSVRAKPRASNYAATHPLDNPVSLHERSFESQVRKCEAQGFSLGQTTAATGLPRSSVVRLCHEFGLTLRGPHPTTPAQIVQALRGQFAAGRPWSVACRNIGVPESEAQPLYAEHLELDPEAPTPPATRVASASFIVAQVTIGIAAGKRIKEIAEEHGLDLQQTYETYERFSRRRRRRPL